MIRRMISLSIVLISILFSINVFAQDDAAESGAEPAMPSEQTPPAGTTESPADSSAESPQAMPAKSGSVERAIFTTNVVDREPVDNLSTANTSSSTVFFFTELVDFDGQTVTHRWQYNGETMAEVNFDVRGPRWRVHSSKNFLPEWVGTWTVSVVDSSGQVVKSETLEYVAAPDAVEATPDTMDVNDQPAAEEPMTTGDDTPGETTTE